MRRPWRSWLAVAFLVAACVTVVVAFQVTRPRDTVSRAVVFVPSPDFFKDFSPAFRTVAADVYWLATIQYYGEHIEGDKRLDSLPSYVRLVTDLSPRFWKAYLFGAFALIDAGKGQEAYELLVRGARRNPDVWQVKTTLGSLIYMYARNEDKAELAAEWYEKAAAVPGRPDWVPRVAAALLAKGGESEKAALMWAQVYATGDTYAQEKAVAALGEILPQDATARVQALQPLGALMTPQKFTQLSAILLETL